MSVLLLGVSGSASGQAASVPGSSSTAGQQPAVTAQPAQSSRHTPIHVVPFGPPVKSPRTQGQPIGELSNNGRVQYWGGPVISNVHVVEVLWGSFVDTASTTGLDQFFTDITQSNYLGLLAEYSTVGLTGFGGLGGTNQTIGLGFFDSKVAINPSLCPGAATNPPPCTITDAQIQTEIVNQLNAGKLPTPVQDSQGNFNTIYMVYFPPGVSIILAPGVDSCRLGGFCAYHSNVAMNLQPKLPYGVFPDFGPTSACSASSQACGAGNSQQNLTSASSHELGEAITDVEVGSFNGKVPAPPLAWVDQNSGEEIGDFCNQADVQITVNSHPYTVQSLWSNMQGQCVVAPSHFQMQTLTANAVPGVPFQVTVAAQSSVNFQLGGYNNTVHFTSSDGGAVLPSDYTFVPSTDGGSHSFTVTLHTIGNQTIAVTDTVISAMTGSAAVDIEHNPDLVVASFHNGSFKQGDTGDVYTLTVTNIGDQQTTGAQVMVTDSLPVGLTATAMSGVGWTCTVGTVTCTTTNTVGPGASYPPITLTVNVAFNAAATLTPVVQVAGGGELNTSNDRASDPTSIIQFPDLVVFKGHNGTFSQGRIAATYTLAVQNVGFVPTSGAIILTDQLPAGLTATAISGAGWNCSAPPTLSCTRNDSLPAGADYPAVTLTVNVDANAPMPTVTNVAMVSGGGEINTANDTATDVTTIIPPTPDVAISATHSPNLTQGQVGATYTLTVTNVGPAPTTGIVTVSDSLPLFFTATAISGNGWACGMSPTLSCQRSDSLAAFTGGTPPAYPPVTVTFNISPTAIEQETNIANVCCGGEGMTNTQNDSQVDNLTVIQLPNMVVNQTIGQIFVQGLNGATFNLTASNASSASTSGTVTVVDTFSSGLTATAISGPGWNCTLATLTCTRSDSLGPNFSYPVVTLAVNVAANAPSSVTNTVTVSGGGEIITSDDTSTFTAPVLPALVITPSNPTQTVKAGNSASFLLGVSAPLPGSMTVTCSSGVPPGAACLISPAAFTAPFTGNVSIMVTTTSALGLARPWPGTRATPLYAALVACLGLVMMQAGKTRRGARLAVFGTLFLMLCCPGCGGGGSSTPPPPPRVATPPGTYTITLTVNNTTSNTQASTPLTLTVQ